MTDEDRSSPPGRLRVAWSFMRGRDWVIHFPMVWLAAIAVSIAGAIPASESLPALLVVTAAGVPLIAGAYVANDFFDWEADHFGREPVPGGARRRLQLSAALLVTGLVLVHTLFWSPAAIGLAWIQTVLGLAYSAPPVRFKERGLLGVVMAAGLQRVPPLLMFCLLTSATVAVSATATAWIFTIGLVFIVEHQISDHAADTASGVVTYVGSIGLERAADLRLRLRPTMYALALTVPLTTTGPGRFTRGAAAVAVVIGLTAAVHGIVRRHYRGNDAVLAS